MPGLAEGMEGVKAGETREIRITFPDKLGPQGGDLEGTKAVFEVEAVEVQVRPHHPMKNVNVDVLLSGVPCDRLWYLGDGNKRWRCKVKRHRMNFHLLALVRAHLFSVFLMLLLVFRWTR